MTYGMIFFFKHEDPIFVEVKARVLETSIRGWLYDCGPKNTYALVFEDVDETLHIIPTKDIVRVEIATED